MILCGDRINVKCTIPVTTGSTKCMISSSVASPGIPNNADSQYSLCDVEVLSSFIVFKGFIGSNSNGNSDGKVKLEGKNYTVLLAPMDGFYTKQNFGKTQVRLAMVESEEKMMFAPIILKKLLSEYLK